MAYTGEWCQVEVAECLSKSVGPGVWTERVVLRPANTSLFDGCEHEWVATPGPQTDRARDMVKAFIAKRGLT
jgi:hypothetical protein